jgi:5-formyltetrahydrofolate cyclo-ligase
LADVVDAPDSGASKTEWRTWAREVRAGLDFPALSEGVCKGLEKFPPLRHPATVLLYMAMADEIDLTSLVRSDLPVRWVTTRTPERGPLTIHAMDGPMEVHDLGFPQPHASAERVPSAEVDVALIPGLAFDLYGNRLGRGMGYFDQLLARLRAGIVRVGVVPTNLVADRLPKEEHDVPVQWLASEEGVVGVAY